MLAAIQLGGWLVKLVYQIENIRDLRDERNEDGEKTFQTVSNGEVLVPAMFHPSMVVNRENLKLTVISEGYQKAEEVYK